MLNDDDDEGTCLFYFSVYVVGYISTLNINSVLSFDTILALVFPTELTMRPTFY